MKSEKTDIQRLSEMYPTVDWLRVAKQFPAAGDRKAAFALLAASRAAAEQEQKRLKQREREIQRALAGLERGRKRDRLMAELREVAQKLQQSIMAIGNCA